ncbi:MAG: hypothetical protein CMN75_02225, partial [Spirochaeta sp.]|nr:hypothetical protein [Spirochaeta sp.]
MDPLSQGPLDGTKVAGASRHAGITGRDHHHHHAILNHLFPLIEELETELDDRKTRPTPGGPARNRPVTADDAVTDK